MAETEPLPPNSTPHPLEGVLDQYLAQKVAPVAPDSQLLFNRRHISHRVFGTMAKVRARLMELRTRADHEFLTGDFDLNVSADDDAASAELVTKIPKHVAVNLSVTSSIARDWKSVEVEGDLETTIKERIGAAVEQVRQSSTMSELLNSNPHWAPVLQALLDDDRTGREAIAQIDRFGIPKSLLDSKGTFSIDAFPGQDAMSQHRDIARGILDTLREATGNKRQQILEEMRKWVQWMSRTDKAEIAHIPEMLDVYRSVMIHSSTLRDTASSMSGIRDHAVKEVRWNGGFLAEPSEADLKEMIEKGCAQVLLDKDGRNIIGYYGVLTDTETVKKHLAENYGWEEGKVYRSEKDLISGKGKKGQQWTTNKDFVLEMMADPSSVAISIEVAVDDKKMADGNTRRSGAATALKHAVYQQAQALGKRRVLVRYFELRSVNGRKVSGVKNSASGIFTEILGGNNVGFYRENVPRKAENLDIVVDWQLSIADIAQSLEIIESGRR